MQIYVSFPLLIISHEVENFGNSQIPNAFWFTVQRCKVQNSEYQLSKSEYRGFTQTRTQDPGYENGLYSAMVQSVLKAQTVVSGLKYFPGGKIHGKQRSGNR